MRYQDNGGKILEGRSLNNPITTKTMSQFDRIGKSRFSRRQITKRSYNLGSGLSNKADSAKKENNRLGLEKMDTNKTSKVVRTPHKEQLRQKSVQDYFVTPPGPQNISTIGDVSVSFLSSTPKPGKTQLSRKRPLSAVHESTISKTNKHPETTKPHTSPSTNSLNQQQTDNTNTLKHRSKTDDTQEKHHSALSNDRSNSRSHLHDSNSDTSNNKPQTRNQSRILSSSQSTASMLGESATASSSRRKVKNITRTSTPLRSSESVSRPKQSEKRLDSNAQPQRRNRTVSILEVDVYDFDVASVDNDNHKSPLKQRLEEKSYFTSTSNSETIPKKKSKISTAVASVRVRSTTKPSQSLFSMQESRTSPGHRDNYDDRIGKISSDEEYDIFVQNKENSPVKRKLPPQTKPANKKKHSAVLEGDVSVRKVMVLQDGRTRKRSDMLDVDVALTTMTETLELQMGVCETQKEQTAIRLLEKYLVQDITRKIGDMQNVKKLQDKIRKSSQTIKERKKHLMLLQKNKANLLRNRGDIEDKKQSADNMKEINNFLSGMKQFISQL